MASPRYRYYTAYVLPSVGVTALVDLSLYGVFMDKKLSGAGNFTGTFRLGNNSTLNKFMMESSVPGLHAIAVKRDDQLVWAGPLWSRTYNPLQHTIQLTGQTFESVFEHHMVGQELVYAGVEQVDIIDDWLIALQTQELLSRSDYGISLGVPPTNGGVTGVTRICRIISREMRQFSEIFQYVEGHDGLAYTINTFSSIDEIGKVLQLYDNDPTRTVAATENYFEYPGSVAQYWLTENGSQSAMRYIIRGPGDLSGKSTATPLYDTSNNWPLTDNIQSFTNITDQDTLDQKAEFEAMHKPPPLQRPQVQLSQNANFQGWNDLGKLFTFRAQDRLFPSGQEFTRRLVGWSLRPGSSESGLEEINIELEGSDG